MATKEFYIDNIGTVRITRRKGSKRISMRVKSDGSIGVNYPWFGSQREVVNFIESNLDWIKKQQQKLSAMQLRFELNQIVETKLHSIQILPIEKGTVRAVRKGKQVVITIPGSEDVSSERIQNFIKRVVTNVCRMDAKEYLPKRVAELAKLHGFSYQQVFVKNHKSKWGSCSSLGNINLNLHLVRVPDHLIDYIILHELAHTREMNHGPQFWAVVNSVTNGRAKQLDKEMKAQSRLVLR